MSADVLFRDDGALNIDSHIGLRIRQCRLSLGLTRGEFAKSLGYSTAQIEDFENGVAQIAAETLFDIAQSLGVEVMDFFQGAASYRNARDSFYTVSKTPSDNSID